MLAAHLAPAALTTSTLVRLGRITNRTFVLPLLILFPTGRCNSRCVSCDWWKQSGADDLTIEEMRALAQSLPSLGTRGVARLRREAPGLPVTGRATLHRANFRELPRLIDHAKAIGLDGISFLPADVSSRAFGRDSAPDATTLALDADEVAAFAAVVER